MRSLRKAALRTLAVVLAVSLVACGDPATPATPDGGADRAAQPALDDADATGAVVSPKDTEYCGPDAQLPTTRQDGAFQFGYVLPATGDLSFLGPPMVTGLLCAMSAINAAGGVNGQLLAEPIAGDEANDADAAAAAARSELDAGVDAIIGAAGTGMTMAIIDAVTSSLVAECSGSNTGVVLTDYPGKAGPDGQQYYFRTAPSDALQGPVLGNLVLADGWRSVAVVYRDDDYGRGLAENTADAVRAGGGSVVLTQSYDTQTADFGPLAQAVIDSGADAMVSVSFEEGFALWKALIDLDVYPDRFGMYGADGMRSEGAAELFDNPADISGAGGTAPASVDNARFVEHLEAFAPDLTETQFASQVYDCVTIMALAAEVAHSNRAPDWVSAVNRVTRDGQTCYTFAQCKKLLDAEMDIHYIGAGGDLSFTAAGEPGKAVIEVYRYGRAGVLDSVGTELSVISE